MHYWDLFLVGLSRGSAFILTETSLVSTDFNVVLCFCVALVTAGEGGVGEGGDNAEGGSLVTQTVVLRASSLRSNRISALDWTHRA